MAESARVRSIDAIRRFREALAEFADGVSQTLAAVDTEIGRARGWLEHDQPSYWKQQIRLGERREAEARAALHRKRLQQTEGYIPDLTVEKEALRLAKAQIEEAHRKLELIRRWIPQFQHAVSEYKGRVQALRDFAGAESERSLAELDRMIEALESYIHLAPPRAPEVPGPSQAEQTARGGTAATPVFSWSPQRELAEATDESRERLDPQQGESRPSDGEPPGDAG